MRPVDKDLFTTNQITYNPYGDAKDDLILALGNFCSYCERRGYSSALDVEHIDDKDTYPNQKFNWNNFLLACKNCNSIKGTKAIEDSLMPHIDNTFTIFSYLESGLIIINTNVTAPLNLDTKVQKLMNLVGLDRIPGHPNYSYKDKRWQERKKVWELSNKYLGKYKNGKCDIDTIKDLALNSGFWSIWMTIFNDKSEVKEELVNYFNGTKIEYFNS